MRLTSSCCVLRKKVPLILSTKLTFINDSTALVAFSVNNFLFHMDTIGKAARQVTEANYKLLMKYQNGRWLVSLKRVFRKEEKTFY